MAKTGWAYSKAMGGPAITQGFLCLDGSHPDARAFVAAAFSRWRDIGVTYAMCDYSRAGAGAAFGGTPYAQHADPALVARPGLPLHPPGLPLHPPGLPLYPPGLPLHPPGLPLHPSSGLPLHPSCGLPRHPPGLPSTLLCRASVCAAPCTLNAAGQPRATLSLRSERLSAVC